MLPEERHLREAWAFGVVCRVAVTLAQALCVERCPPERLCLSLLDQTRHTMSVLLPSEIVKPGMLKNDVWIAGMLVRTRERNTDTNAIPSGEGKARGDTKGKSVKPRRCLELHVNDGTSPAEVILVGNWDSEATTRLQAPLVR